MASLMAECPECAAEWALPTGTTTGEILPCPECGKELEVKNLDPVELVPAPEEDEDWGE